MPLGKTGANWTVPIWFSDQKIIFSGRAVRANQKSGQTGTAPSEQAQRLARRCARQSAIRSFWRACSTVSAARPSPRPPRFADGAVLTAVLAQSFKHRPREPTNIDGTRADPKRVRRPPAAAAARRCLPPVCLTRTVPSDDAVSLPNVLSDCSTDDPSDGSPDVPSDGPRLRTFCITIAPPTPPPCLSHHHADARTHCLAP